MRRVVPELKWLLTEHFVILELFVMLQLYSDPLITYYYGNFLEVMHELRLEPICTSASMRHFKELKPLITRDRGVCISFGFPLLKSKYSMFNMASLIFQCCFLL